MSLYQKIKVAFFSFFALLAIIAVLIEYSVFRQVNYSYDRGKENREMLAKKIPGNKLSQIDEYKQEYFQKSNILRNKLDLQANLIKQADILKDDVSVSISGYHRIINDQIELYKECNKKLATIFKPEELNHFKRYDSFCFFQR